MRIQPKGENLWKICTGSRLRLPAVYSSAASTRFNTDTILLAHFAAPKHKERCIDLGTGCGTISLLWQANYAPRHITAVELGEQAFSQALRSVSENGYEENIEVIRGDIREIKKSFRTQR